MAAVVDVVGCAAGNGLEDGGASRAISAALRVSKQTEAESEVREYRESEL